MFFAPRTRKRATKSFCLFVLCKGARNRYARRSWRGSQICILKRMRRQGLPPLLFSCWSHSCTPAKIQCDNGARRARQSRRAADVDPCGRDGLRPRRWKRPPANVTDCGGDGSAPLQTWPAAAGDPPQRPAEINDRAPPHPRPAVTIL